MEVRTLNKAKMTLPDMRRELAAWKEPCPWCSELEVNCVEGYACGGTGEVPLIPKLSYYVAVMTELEASAVSHRITVDLTIYEAAFTVACIEWLLKLDHRLSVCNGDRGLIFEARKPYTRGGLAMDTRDLHKAVVRAMWQVAMEVTRQPEAEEVSDGG